jgi:hypothetical protein
MAFATGGYHGLRYVAETAFGVTPDTPEMNTVRHTGCSLILSKDSFQSNELRADRQISDMRQGANQIGGNVDFELTYGDFDAFLEAALFGTWATDVLKAGVDEKYFTLERAFADIAQYGVFKGCMMNSLSLSIQPNAIVTGSFGVLGKSAAYSAVELDATPTDASTNSPFDSFSGVIKEGGAIIGVVTGLDLSLDNGGSPQYVIGSPDTPRITNGRSTLTGTLNAFFEDTTMIDKFINETESSIELTLGDGVSSSYTILLPRIKYSGADNSVSGEDPIVLDMPFQAIYDATEATNIKITRIP